MHEIYGSICESKCESGFDWSTFPPAEVIFDWLWPKGLITPPAVGEAESYCGFRFTVSGHPFPVIVFPLKRACC